jgi:integrase
LWWDERRQRWIASVSVGFDARGKRVYRRASGRTKGEAQRRLRELQRDVENGLSVDASRYTVKDAVEDWLRYGLGQQSGSTVRKYRNMVDRHIIPKLGARRLRDLTPREVDAWLSDLADQMSTEPLHRVHGCLRRSLRRAMARDLVSRNVAEMVDVPAGRKPGRPSKSLTVEQVDQVLRLTEPDRMHAYIVVSLLTGGRTEELRALRWDHVHMEETRAGARVMPPYMEVWRSVRSGGDTKTRRSRRTLALPALCLDALRKQKARQAEDRLAAGPDWQETGLVFTTLRGTEMDAANVRRDFRRALALVPGVDPDMWTPRELRHSFVSVLSDAGMRVEEISQLVGHSGTTVTELVYRHQLRPVVQTGATLMDELFGRPGREA